MQGYGLQGTAEKGDEPQRSQRRRRNWTADYAGIGRRPDRSVDMRELKVEQIWMAQINGDGASLSE